MKKSKYWIVFTGVLIGAVSYWRVPYADLNLNDLSTWLFVGSVSFIGGFVLKLAFRQAPFKLGLFTMLGVVASILLRIIYDVIILDTSSHNMAPIEIIITALQSFPVAVVGAYIAVLFKKL